MLASKIIKKILKDTGEFADGDIEESAQFVEDYVKAMLANINSDIMKTNPMATLLKKKDDAGSQKK